MSESSWDCFLGRKPQTTVWQATGLSTPAGATDVTRAGSVYSEATQRYERASVPHPVGLNTQITAPPNAPVSHGEFLARTVANALSLSWMSVQPSTLQTYLNGWKQWTTWSGLFGTDPWMRTRPPGLSDMATGVFPFLLSCYEVCVHVILPCMVVDRSRFEAQHLFGLLIGGTLYAEPLQYRYQLHGDEHTYQVDKDGHVDRIPLHTPRGR